MTSITAQNLGSVAASADTSQATRGNQVQRQSLGTTVNPQQVVQQTQAISNTTSTKAQPDKNRSPQVPKKVEAGFTSQEDTHATTGTRRRAVPPEGEHEKDTANDQSLDVVV